MSLKVVAEQLLGSAEQVSELVVSLKFVAEQRLGSAEQVRELVVSWKVVAKQRLLSLSLKVACCELEGCCGATVIVSEPECK